MSEPKVIQEILENELYITKTRDWVFGICFALIVIILLLVAIIFSVDEKKVPNKDFISGILIFFVGVLGSYVATDIFERIRTTSTKTELKNRLKSQIQPEILTDILENHIRHEKKYCTKYNIIACIEKYENIEDLFKMNVKYVYNKVNLHRELRFKFRRINGNTESGDESNKHHLINEFYYTSIETTFPETPNLEDLYDVTSLRISQDNGEKINCNLTGYLKKVVMDNEIIISLIIDSKIYKKLQLSSEINIEYEVTYPIETESVITFTLDLPTKGFSCELDYSRVNTIIAPISFDLLSCQNDPLADPNHRNIKYSTLEWLLPKSSIVYAWWRK